ncbi:FAD/NAD(P)-binding domain-containing protein [Ophiobolus disseminans]|uniref:FAD/NAD(P)-binding domain-containing protein n=1 Tax=Ophiobolus disseminans TaxID=1469910 RepID=A0A6A6ZEV3_9PLEO|nr:FAD/NAD(P)-binding domain-containing protein [Ophiobolus disseminans]
MAEQRNIVIVGASSAGLMAAHNYLKFILPALKAKAEAKYHVYLINPSPNWYFRVASPRAAASTKRMAVEKLVFDIEEAFSKYSSDDFTFLEAAATGLDTSARTISYKSKKSVNDESLDYHALVVATGSKTYYPAFSQSAGTQEVFNAIKITNEKVEAAKDIVIVGGGPTAIEFAAEVAEHRNGKPGWFGGVQRKANITVITAADRLLTPLRPAISKTAEQKLKALGIDVVYNSRVVDAQEDKNGRTTIILAKGDKLEADLYVPAYGVLPNSSWLPSNLLNESNYLKTDLKMRVAGAGPRVYAFGDVASYSRNNIWDILFALPVLAVNMKRDLLSFNAMLPDEQPKGKDRVYTIDTREGMMVPMGTTGGVGAVFGWRIPNFVVWLAKGRDYMLSMSGKPAVAGETVKETAWTKEEAAI